MAVMMIMPFFMAVVVLMVMFLFMTVVVLMIMLFFMAVMMVVVMMMMVVIVFSCHDFLHQFRFQILCAFDCLQNIRSFQFFPGRRDDRRLRIMFSQHGSAGRNFFFAHLSRPA